MLKYKTSLDSLQENACYLLREMGHPFKELDSQTLGFRKRPTLEAKKVLRATGYVQVREEARPAKDKDLQKLQRKDW
jgi:hypothetical protein